MTSESVPTPADTALNTIRAYIERQVGLAAIKYGPQEWEARADPLLVRAARALGSSAKAVSGAATETPDPLHFEPEPQGGLYSGAVSGEGPEPPTRDQLSAQWEDCKVCGGDHWTKDHVEWKQTPRHDSESPANGERLLQSDGRTSAASIRIAELERIEVAAREVARSDAMSQPKRTAALANLRAALAATPPSSDAGSPIAAEARRIEAMMSEHSITDLSDGNVRCEWGTWHEIVRFLNRLASDAGSPIDVGP